MSQARRKLQAKLFKVSQYILEYNIGPEEDVKWSGQKRNGTVSVVRGVETNKGGCLLLCIFACLGAIRILSAVFVDYGNVSEKHLYKEHFETHIT